MLVSFTGQSKTVSIGSVALAVVFFVGSAFAGTATYSSLQKSKWSSCSACAGAGGSGPTASYSQVLYISSPSLSGSASKFSIGGSTPYANALWWKQVGANSAAHNFKYDLYFYIKNPSAAQALEFDVNQSVGGHKYIFGTQCNIKGSGTWDVYSAAYHWKSTGIACHAPTAYKWHHLTWQFQRTSGSNVKFVSVTLDGVTHYVNRVYAPKSSSVNELNAAFQMDGNKYMTDYQVWLDKVTLTAW
ncbi:MAG TPA: hypothetical protein VFU86_21875 [Terriglobales bacterium]|nr:hypothetical protein [Terriglobales bacterium]